MSFSWFRQVGGATRNGNETSIKRLLNPHWGCWLTVRLPKTLDIFIKTILKRLNASLLRGLALRCLDSSYNQAQGFYGQETFGALG
jgi:hypothetical protein